MIYRVQTEKFGELLLAADDIRDARRRAKRSFGAGPRQVNRVAVATLCERCECRPCCCERRKGGAR